jgi:hypothetical protein
MTISSTTSLTNLSQLLQTTGSTSNSTESTIGSELLAALEQGQAGSSQSTSSLVQDIVSLSSNNSVLSSTGNASTYNAQGLLDALQNSTLSNDPMLQMLDGSSNGQNASSTSLLNALIPSNTGTSASSASNLLSSSSAITNTGSISTPSLAQMVQSDPSLGTAILESQVNQNILNMFSS